MYYEVVFLCDSKLTLVGISKQVKEEGTEDIIEHYILTSTQNLER